MNQNLLSLLRNEFNQANSIEEESQNKDYHGYLIINQRYSYRIRVAKTTPKKMGQFVAIWEKDKQQHNTAYTYESFPDFLVVYCFKDQQIGKFIFPKDVLTEQKILKTQTQKGKMAFRVYPLWDQVSSKQASKTQAWQASYFQLIESLD